MRQASFASLMDMVQEARIYRLTFEAFMGNSSFMGTTDKDVKESNEEGDHLIQHNIRPIHEALGGLPPDMTPCRAEGYRMYVPTEKRGIIVLYAPDGSLAGGMAGIAPCVSPEHRGRGLGADILLLAFASGIRRLGDGGFMSPMGHRNRRACHRLCVEVALTEGMEVPAEVQAEYPDLVKAPAAKI